MSIKYTMLKNKNLKALDDFKLINEALAGNMNAFGDIVNKYESMVAKIIIPMLGNSYDADDIGQETFIRLYKSLDKFKGESQLGTYLARIAINLSLNEIKKRSQHRNLTLDNNNELPNVENERSKDITDMVNSSLEALDPKFRSVIVLRHIQGFSTKETATILNLPLGTVLSRLSRGQNKLKKIITNQTTI